LKVLVEALVVAMEKPMKVPLGEDIFAMAIMKLQEEPVVSTQFVIDFNDQVKEMAGRCN